MNVKLIQVLMKEVVLDDNDIPKALLEYIGKNLLNNIVIGASTRNAFARFSLSLSLFTQKLSIL